MSDSSQPAPISKHKLAEARRLGYTARSPELTAGVVLLAAAWVGHVCLPQLILACRELVITGFQGRALSLSQTASEFHPALIRVGQEVLRIGAACWAAALVADVAQVGFVWSPDTLLPHEERISPAAGLSRMLSWPTFERASLLSMKLMCGMGLVAFLMEWAMRSVFTAEESASHLARGAAWTSLLLACVGATCLLSGILDAWVRQSRWRGAIEQTDDERRRGD